MVVGIGASAGGLEACSRLMAALPADTGMAFVLVQHLDPTHESMMAGLLAGHTSMTVLEAVDGMPVEPNHLYVIPPGTYLAVAGGTLHLTRPRIRHGARLPFDFLLHSLAEAYGPRAVAVVLSGTGADGSLEVRAVKDRGGYVLAQDPEEAGFDGMPRNAVATGAVDRVLPVDEIARALVAHAHRPGGPAPAGAVVGPDRLPEIIDLLRAGTPHDFSSYKPGTLRRRIERRMAASADASADAYLERLRGDPVELDRLAKDLLINVTGFFRDPDVFGFLGETVVPEIIRDHASDRPVRLWVPGCSTGEEAYSLAMLFVEAIAVSGRNLKLQVFASDVDADAVATAREGLYPTTIEAEVSPARLARFFRKEEHGWRVDGDLRGLVVFTVQDILVDPPFSRLDMVSCRNLLIYLGRGAQSKVLALLHFALREGGVLLLGNAESAGDSDGRFEPLSKLGRLFRRVGHSRLGDFWPATTGGVGLDASARRRPGRSPTRQSALADLCRRLVMEAYAPAAVLVDRRFECLYSLGPTDRYLRVAAGYPSHDLLALAPEPMRIKLRSAIQRAAQEKARIDIGGGHVVRDGVEIAFRVEVRPVLDEDEEMFLVCFVEDRAARPKSDRATSPRDDPRLADLEHELEATRQELQGAIHNLEAAVEEQKVVNEEALSANEEFQSTNEELLTSKEELQSLNEELTALNSQLQETLERHRTTSADLQNVLYSTDVATLFLDTGLKIRFFTPATRSLFSILPGDVGRPLADLRSLAGDDALTADAASVMKTAVAVEREIEVPNGTWFVRRILPYRTLDDRIEGVVITFADITERRCAAQELDAAKRRAEQATVAKSRFLAAASHDLRQPLQTLCLLQGLLATVVEGDRAERLVARFDDTLSAMTGMLDALLDMNQIEAGAIHPNPVETPIGDLLARMRNEFSYPTEAKGIGLRVVDCGRMIRSDPRLLEQMLRNLLANAVKYTTHGKILLGCRRRGDRLRIEVWDTGIGISAAEHDAIFEEYHQVGNEARDRVLGLGLGLSIVRRLGDLLGHRVLVDSRPGAGSVFSIEVALVGDRARAIERRPAPVEGRTEGGRRIGSILIVEDEAEVRDLLELILEREGHLVVSAPDGVAAVKLVEEGTLRPDLVLADFNLPGGIDGLDVVARVRKGDPRRIPAIILTGDISIATLRDIAARDCVHLDKPVTAKALIDTIGRLLAAPASAPVAPEPPPVDADEGPRPAVVHVVDDDAAIRDGMRAVLEGSGLAVETWPTGEAFLAGFRPGGETCLLVDACLPGMSGQDLLLRLKQEGHQVPSIMITGNSDVAMAVQAMKAGASDFLEKPVRNAELLAGVARALEHAQDDTVRLASHEAAATRIAGLTPRQIQVMDMVLAGAPSKNIATDLGISRRTVENHRASIMTKTGARSLPALARLVVAARG